METKDRYLDINWSFSTSYLFKNMENVGKCLATRFVLQVTIFLTRVTFLSIELVAMLQVPDFDLTGITGRSYCMLLRGAILHRISLARNLLQKYYPNNQSLRRFN